MKDLDDWLPDPQVCKRYGIASCTLWRWDRNPNLNFPKARRVNGRKYRRIADLKQWEMTRPLEAA